MSDKEELLQAEALVRLSQNNDGALFLKLIGEQFDKEMRTLLYVESEKLATQQGVCRAYHDVLDIVMKAKKTLEGNTHGAS